MKKITTIALALIVFSTMSITLVDTSKVQAATNPTQFKTVQEKINVTDKEKRDLMTGKITKDEFLKKHPEIKQMKEEDLKSKPIVIQNSLPVIKQNSLTTTGSKILRDDFNFGGGYGGDQSRFANTSSSYINEFGCGAIALSNIAAYFKESFHFNTYPYGYDFRIDPFMAFEKSMYDRYLQGPSITIDMIGAGTRYFNDCQCPFAAANSVSCWKSYSDEFTSMVDMIQFSIDNNLPVAILSGPNYTASYTNKYKTHWMTITGYFYADGMYLVDVSTWGQKETINLRDLAQGQMFVDVVVFHE